MIAILTASLTLGQLDPRTILALDEESRIMWIGELGEDLEPIRIDEITDAPRRSMRTPTQKAFHTSRGELTLVKSPNGGQTYLWHQARPGVTRGKQLSICRAEDFVFEADGKKLNVVAKERSLYCVGRGDDGFIAVTVVADTCDPESATIYRGPRLKNLRRKMSYNPQVTGSRLELLIGGNAWLACSPEGMLFKDKAIPMLDASAYKLEISSNGGYASLTK